MRDEPRAPPRVEPRAIKRTMLLTVEGERDDICGVGHYGVFSGNRWTNQIYPLVKNVILASE
jgi:poly(3-hydroxybutyrate) depolymerase